MTPKHLVPAPEYLRVFPPPLRVSVFSESPASRGGGPL
jgi:hypothetical protein